jgi:hypothetical protein
MNVHFTTTDFGDEAASLAAAEAGRPLAEEAHILGNIVLEHAGQKTLSIYDDLPFLVQALCVQTPAALRQSGQAEVRLVEWPNRLTLRIEGEDIHITGEQGENARYPRAAFLSALHDCGGRFATFLEHIAEFAPDFEQRAEWLRAAIAA